MKKRTECVDEIGFLRWLSVIIIAHAQGGV